MKGHGEKRSRKEEAALLLIDPPPRFARPATRARSGKRRPAPLGVRPSPAPPFRLLVVERDARGLHGRMGGRLSFLNLFVHHHCP